MQAVPVTLTLNQNELLVFLSLMGAAAFNGFDDSLAWLGEQEMAQRLDEGQESLAARGLLTIVGENELIFDDVLVALVGGSLVPDATLALSRMGPDNQPVTHYFSATPELLVEHYSPSPASYRFDYLADAPAVEARLAELLAPLAGEKVAAGSDGAQVPAASLTAFFEYCRQAKPDQARQALIGGGCALDLAEALAGDCPSATSWVGLAAWGLRKPEPEGADSVMVLAGAKRCWIVHNVAGRQDQVSIRQADGPQGVEAISGLLDPLKQILRIVA